MHILWKRRPAGDESRSQKLRVALASAAACVVTAIVTGCASPGAPLPPSLKLPEPVTDLTASRVGDAVELHWTTPARTTDRLLITQAVTAEICRDAAAHAAGLAGRQTQRRGPGGQPTPAACNVVHRLQVSPGPSEAQDVLPPELAGGAPGVLAYRVQLLNNANRTAAPSAAAYAGSGAAPEPVTRLRATSTKAGVVLEWAHVPSTGEEVELTRMLQVSAAAPKPVQPTAAKDSLLKSAPQPDEARFSARDTGGAIDRTAAAGETYRYSAERVRRLTLEGRIVELRSAPSTAVEVQVPTVFPPDTPTGLVAGPAYSAAGSPAVDLSWEPDVELHIAGYRVYRREGDGAWQVVTAELVPVAAYTDTSVMAGQQYTYRVTAVNEAGLESAPSGEVSQKVASR